MERKIAVAQAQPLDIETALNKRVGGAARHVHGQPREARRLELWIYQVEQLCVRAPVSRDVERGGLTQFYRTCDFE